MTEAPWSSLLATRLKVETWIQYKLQECVEIAAVGFDYEVTVPWSCPCPPNRLSTDVAGMIWLPDLLRGVSVPPHSCEVSSGKGDAAGKLLVGWRLGE